MDLACKGSPTPACPSRRRAERRALARGRSTRIERFVQRSAARVVSLTRVGQSAREATAPSRWLPSIPVTVAELSQVPGARQALANYVGILQEWSSRAEHGGAAPQDWPQ